jgi:hypothetical protein
LYLFQAPFFHFDCFFAHFLSISLYFYLSIHLFIFLTVIISL